MTIDGRAIADDMYAELSERRGTFERPITLGILVVGVDPVIESFVGIKTRAAERLAVTVQRVDLQAGATTEAVIEAVRAMNESTDALIVQLPMPKQIDTNAVLSAIEPMKDVDAINPMHSAENSPIDAPVALAVVEILERGNISIAGKKAVVIGAGRLVGAPTAELLKKLGANVSMFTLEEGSIDDLKDADIVVCEGFKRSTLPKIEIHRREAHAAPLLGTPDVDGATYRAIVSDASMDSPVPVIRLDEPAWLDSLADLVEREIMNRRSA